RRRHTRSKRDWSSDVCSSDLNQVHAWLAGRWEKHATVNDQQFAVIFEDGHVAADFRDATQCVNTQRALSLLWWLRKTLGQIRALHGLWHVPSVVIISAATVATSALIVVATLAVIAALVVVAIIATPATAAGTTGTGATVVISALATIALVVVAILRAILVGVI